MKVAVLAAVSSLASIALAQSKLELCDVGHDKFIKSAPPGFKTVTTRNEKVGARISSIIAPDGSSVSILTVPASHIPAFKDLPISPLGVQCLSPNGGLNEVLALYEGPIDPTLPKKNAT